MTMAEIARPRGAPAELMGAAEMWGATCCTASNGSKRRSAPTFSMPRRPSPRSWRYYAAGMNRPLPARHRVDNLPEGEPAVVALPAWVYEVDEIDCSSTCA